MIFTDENGAKFTALGIGELWDGDGKIVRLKPVKQEPKWIIGHPMLMYDGGDYTFAVTFPATEDQAQLIKEAVEALMTYLTLEDTRYEDKEILAEARDKARQSLKEDN